MLNGNTHSDHAPPMPSDGDGGASVQLALLDREVRSVRTEVHSLRKDVQDLKALVHQARGVLFAVGVVFAVASAGPRLLDWLRPQAPAAAQAPPGAR